MAYDDLKALIGALQASTTARPSDEDQVLRPLDLVDGRYVNVTTPYP